MEDKLRLLKMFLAMGSMTHQTPEEKLAYQERIIFATEGIIKPEDWDSLSFDEKVRRLELLIKHI